MAEHLACFGFLGISHNSPKLTANILALKRIFRPQMKIFRIKHTLAFVMLVFSALALHAAERSKPNILFILTDDQGYGDMGRHGHPFLKTPNMDALGEQSVRFTDFCVSPSCSPTRAALMSGMFNLRAGVTHTMHPREHMSQRLTILPQYLKQAGYATGCVGKWHLGEDKGYAPHERGFDFWLARHLNFYTNGKYREDIMFDEAMRFMAECGDKPFFCYLATLSPHTPLTVPDKYTEPYKDKGTDEQAHFFGMIANLDENLGRILRWLDEKKLADDTIVILMNDNGATVGVDVFNAGMRGCKCTVWPGGTRAFSFWRWPGKWKPRDVDALTAHVDLLPTLAALAGAALPAPQKGMELDGRSLVPFLEGGADEWFQERIVFEHNARWPGGMTADHKDSMAGVRWQNYLLTRSHPCKNLDCKKRSVSQCDILRLIERGATANVYTKNAQFIWGVTPGDGWALYDVHKDPACEKNLADAKPDLAARLHKSYDQWWDAIYPQMIADGSDQRVSDEK
jgi:arylsulfatase A-like enzyme